MLEYRSAMPCAPSRPSRSPTCAQSARWQRSCREASTFWLMPSQPQISTALAATRNPCLTLELEQGAEGDHLDAVDFLDLVALPLGAQADLPEIECRAHAVEAVGPGAAVVDRADGRLGLPRHRAALAVDVERPDREDEQAREIAAVQLE